MISLSNSRIYYLFGEFTMNSLDVSQIYFKFTIEFANSLLFTFESRIYYEFTLNFANLILKYFEFHEVTIKSRIDYEFSFCSANSLDVSQIYYEFIVYFANSLLFTVESRIYYQFRELTMKKLRVSRTY